MLRAHRGRAYRVEPDWNVTKANDDRLHADDCGIAAECLRIFNFRLTNRGFPANGAAPRGWFGMIAESRFPVGWPGGRGWRGRREPVPGGLAAAPCRGYPASPTHPAADRFLLRLPHTEKKKEDQKQKQPGWPLFVEPSPRSAAFRPVREADRRLGSIQASAARDPLLLFFFFSVGGAGHRHLSEDGRVGFAGVSAAWMPRPSPQGRVPASPASPTRPSSATVLHLATKHRQPRGAAPLAGNYGHQPRPNRAK